MGYFRRIIEEMRGYIPGEQPASLDKLIKLNTNENPYPPSPRVIEAILREANPSLRLYPDPLATPLREMAARVYQVGQEQVMAGNGSDELLSIIVRAFIGKGDKVAYPVPTYTLYDTLVDIQEGIRELIDYPEDYSLPEELLEKEVRLTFISNPNSPSGTFIPVDKLAGLAERTRGILVIDEAYVDFAPASALPLIREYPNVVVLRSFSKSFSLAGMRIGLAFASPQIIEGLLKVKDSYNLNRLSIVAATAALEDMEWMQNNVARIIRSREVLTEALNELGFKVYPSAANFVLASLPGQDLAWLYRTLKDLGILVRYFPQPRLADCIRITVGTEEEISRLIHELKRVMSQAY